MPSSPIIRAGQAPGHIGRDEFKRRFLENFGDPAFEPEQGSLARIEVIAWEAYEAGRKAPRTRKAGPGYSDPDYELSVDWIEAKAVSYTHLTLPTIYSV